jgi:hypothetical protein
LSIFENKELRISATTREEATRTWRRIHDEELNNHALYLIL